MLMCMPLTFKRICKLIPHRGTKDWERGWFERPLAFPLSLMDSFLVKLKKIRIKIKKRRKWHLPLPFYVRGLNVGVVQA